MNPTRDKYELDAEELVGHVRVRDDRRVLPGDEGVAEPACKAEEAGEVLAVLVVRNDGRRGAEALQGCAHEPLREVPYR